ncbi:MAG: hypothetical protein U9R16_02050 [Campylobacterota bacterium]|nr:hypothetical protein [Campylobacterota bacterium]
MIENIKSFLILLLIGYSFLVVYLYFMQDRLIFPGAYSFKDVVQQSGYIEKETSEFSLKTKDNIKLSGLISQKNSDTLLIYFGGNAENCTNFVSLISKFEKIDSVALNYRGYGKSEGKPSEQKLYTDALEIYDHFKDKYKYIIPVGKSLGTPIATYVSSKRKLQGTILITPLDSITDVAKTIFPILPIKLLLNHPFNSIEHLKNINSPISLLMVKNDEVIPNKNTLNLKENINKLALFTVVENSGHNTITNDGKFFKFIFQSIEKFKL